jgi:hypothetical protein
MDARRLIGPRRLGRGAVPSTSDIPVTARLTPRPREAVLSVRCLGMAVVLIGVLWPLNLGLRVSENDALRIPDVITAATLAIWWLSGGRLFGVRMVGALLASAVLLALGLPGASGFPDVVFLLRIAEAPILAVAAAQVSRGWPYTRMFAGVLLGGALLSSLLLYEAWLGRTGGWTAMHRFDLLLSSVVVEERPGFVYQAGPLLRPSGTLGHPNAAAGVLVLIAAALVGWYARARAGPSRRMAALSLALMTSGALVTGSRGALLAGLIGVVLGLALLRVRSGKGRLGLGLASMALLVGALPLVATGGEGYVTYLGTITQGVQAPTVQGRLWSWHLALALVEEHPLAGIGRARLLSQVPATHNAFLFLAAAGGVPLALFALGLFIAGARRAVWRLSSSRTYDVAAAVAVITAGFLLVLEDRAVDPTFTSLLAFFLGPCLVARVAPVRSGVES